MARIRATLMLQTGFATSHSIAVACSVRAEGCSTIARALANDFARDDAQRVLLIDACVRHPGLHKVVKVALEPGLTDLLAGRQSVETIGAAAKPRTVAILPAGALGERTLALEWTRQLRTTLDQLSTYYNRIIVDAGAIVENPETGFSVGACDACVFVVREGGPREGIVREARRRLEQAQPNILGVVINRARRVIPTWLYRNL